MRISVPKLVADHDVLKITSSVEMDGGAANVWFSVPKRYSEYVDAVVSDAFLVGLVVRAMELNEDIVVCGEVSESLYYFLKKYYIPLLSQASKKYHSINIEVESFSKPPVNGSAVVTGMSCGVDSLCVIADHFFEPVAEKYKVTHLCFNNVGSHGVKRAEKLYRERYAYISTVSNELGLPLVGVNSNLWVIYDRAFKYTQNPRNVAAMMVLQNLFGSYLFASSYRYKDTCMDNAGELAYLDSIAMHLLSSDKMRVILSGAEYSRLEKTRRISSYEFAHRYLNVCVNEESSKNCSTCWKCMRTLLTLEVIGVIERYDKVFDLDKYYKARDWYIQQALMSNDPFLCEIIGEANKVGFSFPRNAMVKAKLKKIIGLKPCAHFG